MIKNAHTPVHAFNLTSSHVNRVLLKMSMKKKSKLTLSASTLFESFFAESGVTISYRYWVPTTKIIETKLAVNGGVYNAIQSADIEIPFPQRVVTLNKE